MKFKKYFTDAVKANYSLDAPTIIRCMEEEFTSILPEVEFAFSSGNPIDRRLIFCGYFLALVKTLDKRGESFENIRRLSLEIVTDYVRPKNKFQQMLKRMPVVLIKFGVIRKAMRIFAKKVGRRGHADGFVAHVLFDKEQTYGLGYGVDILECGICKMFHRHQYDKFAPILCEVDEVTSALAGLKLIRKGTIANGAKKCDFRYARIK